MDDNPWVLLTDASNRIEAEIIKSLLSASDIPCHISADDCGGMAPHLLTGSPVKIFTRYLNFQHAKQLIESKED